MQTAASIVVDRRAIYGRGGSSANEDAAPKIGRISGNLRAFQFQSTVPSSDTAATHFAGSRRRHRRILDACIDKSKAT